MRALKKLKQQYVVRMLPINVCSFSYCSQLCSDFSVGASQFTAIKPNGLIVQAQSF